MARNPHLNRACARERYLRDKMRCTVLHGAGDGATEGNSRKELCGWTFSPTPALLDTGLAPRRNTEGGIQPADKELNQPSSALDLLPCAETQSNE